MVREILTFPHSLLYKKSREIKEVDGRLTKLVEEMLETMYKAPGIGLAAPQIGENIRLIVFDLSDSQSPERRPHYLVNPVITAWEGTSVGEEGCLSVPGVREKVKRFARVEVKGLNLDGREKVWEAQGLMATMFQHEVDHLDGILFIDRLGPLKRRRIKGRLLKKGEGE